MQNFFQDFFKSDASAALEDYASLKEDITMRSKIFQNAEILLLKSKTAYKYANVRASSYR